MKIFTILFLLIFAHCGTSKSPSETQLSSAECALTYDTNENLFSDTDTLIIGVNVIYFMNGDAAEYSKDALDKKFEEISYFFKDALIEFKVSTFKNVQGVPTDNLQLSGSVKEKLTHFNIENYQFFGMMMNEPHVLNVYVYNQKERSSFAGVAGGIGSDYLAIRRDYFDAPTRTLAHELGHCLGLYHTHQPDETDGYNIYSGDKVCDTPASKSLSGLVDRECDLDKTDGSVADSVQLINIMSYSYPFCRKEFTDSQIRRMRWFIEQSKDLQSLLYNRHDLINRKLEETLITLD